MKSHICSSSQRDCGACSKAYVEMSLFQLLGLCQMAFEFLDGHRFSEAGLAAKRVRVYRPRADGSIDFDISMGG